MIGNVKVSKNKRSRWPVVALGSGDKVADGMAGMTDGMAGMTDGMADGLCLLKAMVEVQCGVRA